MPTSNLTSWRDEEELVDYEPEVPPSFSPIQDDISVREDRTPFQEEEQHYLSANTDELPALVAEDGPMAGGKRSQLFSGAARTPSSRQDPDIAKIDTDNHSLSTDNDVGMTGEPADARRKRRRGPDGAVVDGGSVYVGRSNHGIGEASTKSVSAGVGRRVHGVPVHRCTRPAPRV